MAADPGSCFFGWMQPPVATITAINPAVVVPNYHILRTVVSQIFGLHLCSMEQPQTCLCRATSRSSPSRCLVTRGLHHECAFHYIITQQYWSYSIRARCGSRRWVTIDWSLGSFRQGLTLGMGGGAVIEGERSSLDPLLGIFCRLPSSPLRKCVGGRSLTP